MKPNTLHHTLKLIEEVRQLSFRLTAVSARLELNAHRVNSICRALNSVHQLKEDYCKKSKSLHEKSKRIKVLMHRTS